MSRLIAFGCSATYGHGLSDCVNLIEKRPGPTPSNFAWPSLLASKLNLECINTSTCGASNLEILNTILNFSFLETDTVYVMWTFPPRDYFFREDNRHISIFNRHVLDPLTKQWAAVHTEYDLMIRSWIYIHHAYCYLKSKNINFNFIQASRDTEFLECCPEWAKNIEFLPLYIYDLMDHYPLALDNIHLGHEAHEEFFNQIYNIVKKS